MASSAAAVKPPVLRSRPLGALLAAEILSTSGSMRGLRQAAPLVLLQATPLRTVAAPVAAAAVRARALTAMLVALRHLARESA